MGASSDPTLGKPSNVGGGKGPRFESSARTEEGTWGLARA